MAYIQKSLSLEEVSEKEAITMVFFVPNIVVKDWRDFTRSVYNESSKKVDEFIYGIAVGIDPNAVHEGIDVSPDSHSYVELFKLLASNMFYPLSPIQTDEFKSEIVCKLNIIFNDALNHKAKRVSARSKVKSLADSIKHFVQDYIAGAEGPGITRGALSRLSDTTIHNRQWKQNNSDVSLYEEGIDTPMYETGQLSEAITANVFRIPVYDMISASLINEVKEERELEKKTKEQFEHRSAGQKKRWDKYHKSQERKMAKYQKKPEPKPKKRKGVFSTAEIRSAFAKSGDASLPSDMLKYFEKEYYNQYEWAISNYVTIFMSKGDKYIREANLKKAWSYIKEREAVLAETGYFKYTEAVKVGTNRIQFEKDYIQ